jgi:glycogen(starch) synthase
MGEFRGAASFFLAPQALIRAGHEVHMSMPAGGDVPVSPPEAGGGPVVYHGLKLHRYRFAIEFMPKSSNPLYIHLTRPFRYVYYIALALLSALRAARRIRPDVVVGYGAWGAPVAALVAKSLGLPNVTRLFGQSLPPGPRMTARERVRCLLNYPEIVAFLTPCSSLIVCDDGSAGDKVARRLGVPEDRLNFWRNGVDKELFRPPANKDDAKRKLGVDPGAPMILSVSRLDREKHSERLLRALPEVLRSFPRARVFFVGDGPERGFLEMEAARLGVASAVQLTGALEKEELPAYYRACDIFVSLSDRTNIANPTLEAMCCGACAVVLDTGNTGGVIVDGETGRVIANEALSVLGRVLTELLEDEPMRRRLSEGAARSSGSIVPTVEERAGMEAEAVARAAEAAERSG